MNKIVEYLGYAIKNEYPLHLKWMVDMFGIIANDEYEDEYVYKKKDNILVKQDDKIISLYDQPKSPLFNVKDIIKIPKDFLPNLDKDIETTVGRLIMNYLLLAYNFNHKIPYINRKFSVAEIEDIIAKKLTDDTTDPEGIYIKEYIQFVDMVTYIKNFNKINSISATAKTLLPPPDIQKYREQLIAEYKKKYGPKALEKKNVIAEIEKKLEEYEKEYIKKDPAYGKLVTGKVSGARKKMYVSYGTGMEFTPSNRAKYVDKSLIEGWDKDPEKLTVMFNDSRLASYNRGKQTQDGGVVAKITLRAVNDIKILDTDCGTNVTEKVLVTKDNYKKLINRYMIIGNTTVEITEDNIKDYMNKYINLRTPMGCKLEHHYCVRCSTSEMKNYENGLSLLVNEVAGAILNESLKAMHKSGIESTTLNIDDLVT